MVTQRKKNVTYKVKQRAKKDLSVLSDRTKRLEAKQIKDNHRKDAIIHAAKSYIGKNEGKKLKGVQ